MMDLPTQKIVRVCREAIMNACVGRERYTVNELLAAFDAQVELIIQREGPSKSKLPASSDVGGGPNVPATETV
jgi:hypothetical protein